MDKIVDHLLVFRGQGVIKDFPGNYTQFRQWESLASKEESVAKANAETEKKEKREFVGEQRRKKTYKEKCEFERLEKEIAQLEKEQAELAARSPWTNSRRKASASLCSKMNLRPRK